MLLYRIQRSLWLLGICVAMVANAHEGHHDTNGQQKATSFNDPSFTQDEEHLKEHLKDEINFDKNKKMSPEEMEFHYFRLHDANNDTHLDGTEILQAMSHMMPVPDLTLQEKLGKSDQQIESMMSQRRIEMMAYYVDLIDRVLFDDDKDKNGYLSYAEFIRARRREEYNHRRMQEHHMKNAQMDQFQQFQQFQAMQAQQQQMQMQQVQGQGQGQGQGQFRPTIPPPPPPQNGGQQQQQRNI